MLLDDADVAKYIPSEQDRDEALAALQKLPRYKATGKLLELGGYGTCVCLPVLHLPKPLHLPKSQAVSLRGSSLI